jgi:hypothetical protein
MYFSVIPSLATVKSYLGFSGSPASKPAPAAPPRPTAPLAAALQSNAQPHFVQTLTQGEKPKAADAIDDKAFAELEKRFAKFLSDPDAKTKLANIAENPSVAKAVDRVIDLLADLYDGANQLSGATRKMLGVLLVATPAAADTGDDIDHALMGTTGGKIVTYTLAGIGAIALCCLCIACCSDDERLPIQIRRVHRNAPAGAVV